MAKQVWRTLADQQKETHSRNSFAFSLGLLVCEALAWKLRLAVSLLLASQWGGSLTTIAVVCSTFVPVNLFTSQRDALTPLGAQHITAVRQGNKQTSRPAHKFACDLIACSAMTMRRCALLIALITAKDSIWLLENPGGSTILAHPRLQWLFGILDKMGQKAPLPN